MLLPSAERGWSPTSLSSRTLIFVLLPLCSHTWGRKSKPVSSQEGSVLPKPACGHVAHGTSAVESLSRNEIVTISDCETRAFRDHTRAHHPEHFVSGLQNAGLLWPRLLGRC